MGDSWNLQASQPHLHAHLLSGLGQRSSPLELLLEDRLLKELSELLLLLLDDWDENEDCEE